MTPAVRLLGAEHSSLGASINRLLLDRFISGNRRHRYRLSSGTIFELYEYRDRTVLPAFDSRLWRGIFSTPGSARITSRAALSARGDKLPRHGIRCARQTAFRHTAKMMPIHQATTTGLAPLLIDPLMMSTARSLRDTRVDSQAPGAHLARNAGSVSGPCP